MRIAKYTVGLGDRFGHQGKAQLAAVMAASKEGVEVTPVWNKSYREHSIIGTSPSEVRKEADAAVEALGWGGEYYVDADHIRSSTVDLFLEGCDFFTLDVADVVGSPPEAADIESFLGDSKGLLGKLEIPGIEAPVEVTREAVREVAARYLAAIREAGRIYRHIAREKADFVVEISLDEAESPQTPTELLIVLAMIAWEQIPVQTLAPRFTGRFNKGVDYEGDPTAFEKELDEDLAIVRYGVPAFGLPETLKLSIHSGSDKFSLYPVINRLIKRHGAGIHVKTAGTTWLEEIIGLAEAGGEGLEIAREIYRQARHQFKDLLAPYRAVVNIDPARLPPVEEVAHWGAKEYARALRHDPNCQDYNSDLRQFLHIAFKTAADMGDRYTDALKSNAAVIGENVTANLLERHIRPLFK